MNFLINKEYVSEISCGRDFSYVLTNPISLAVTEYKVLQNQKDSFFIRCICAKYNGNIQLYYLTEEYKTLDSMLLRIDAESFIAIITNLFSNIVALKNNGFLSCQNVFASLEKIYVDPATFGVYLIYVPTEQHLYSSISEFENELRTRILRAISEVSTLSSYETMKLFEYLSDSSMSVSDIQAALCGKTRYTAQRFGNLTMDQNTGVKNDKSSARLLSINMPIAVEIRITKDDFIIGKKRDSVDGVIGFSPMVSRIHCKVVKQNGCYYMVDLGSSNGTFVNGKRLSPNVFEQISNGDIIRMANVEFRAIIEWGVI